jgi:hypothetical protein
MALEPIPTIAFRLPDDLLPFDCEFGRDRNDQLNLSPRSRTESVIRRDRPKWKATLSWSLVPEKAKQLQYYIDTMEGFRGSMMIWDYKRPFPEDRASALAAELGGISYSPVQFLFWSTGSIFYTWLSGPAPFFWTIPAVIGSRQVVIIFPPSAYNATILKKGDYIQLKRRLYIVAADVVVYPTTAGTPVFLTTPTLDTLVSTDEVRIRKAACEMRLIEGSWSMTRNANQGYETCKASFMETSQNFTASGSGFAV